MAVTRYLALLGFVVGYMLHDLLQCGSNNNNNNSDGGGARTILMGTTSLKDTTTNMETTDQDTVVQQQSQLVQQQQQQPPPVRQAKLADGCYHVFLDVGANKGVHGRFLLEPAKYPGAKTARRLFDKWYGSSLQQRDSRDICVFAFEPNPTHHARLQHISVAYQAMGWRYRDMPVGVGDAAGNLNFYRRKDQRNEEWGFSHYPRDANSQPVPVPVVRLADWVREHVQGRIIPDRPFATNVTKPIVGMKMDIEAMEFRVMPDLLLSGVFCQAFDFVFGEVHLRHHAYFPLNVSESDVLNNAKEASTFWASLMRLYRMNSHCPTAFTQDDDESYLHDGVPLPQPTA